jgi:cytoskeletal protein RodZ
MKKRTLFLAVGGVIVFACLACTVFGMITNSSPSHKATATAQAIARVTETSKPTRPSEPTATASQPTKTPIPTTAPLAPTTTNTPIPTNTPSTPRTTNTPVPTPTPAAATNAAGILPGLQPADVKVNLQNRQFTCTSAEKGQLYYTWVCKRETSQIQLNVQFYARTLLTVDYISAVVLQFGEADDGVAASFLGFMATMPYTGAEPDNARSWVEKTLPSVKQNGDVRTATFGGVKYELFGLPTARNLQMGTLP